MTAPRPHPQSHPRPTDLRLPSERFYWAVLTASPERGEDLPDPARPGSRAELDDRFAAQVPVHIDTLATAYAALPGGEGVGVLACGFAVDALAAFPDAVTLAPASVPGWLAPELAAGLDPSSLNVLVGEHEPRAVAAWRERRSVTLAASMALVAGLVIVGAWRRASAAGETLARADAVVARAYEQPAAKSLGLTATAPRDAVLEREAQRLRATRNQAARGGLADVSGPLEGLFKRWPQGVKTQVQTLSTDGEQVKLSATVNSLGDAEALAKSLANAPGWEASQPQIASGSKGVQVQLTFKAARAEKAGSP